MSTTLHFNYRPKSFFTLVLLGFGIVSFPLTVALIGTGWYVDRLFIQSESAVYQASQASLISRSLIDQIVAMERNARQYVVLRDEVLLKNYESRREQFKKSALELGRLSDNEFLNSQLATLNAKEEVLYRFLNRPKGDNSGSFKPEEEFSGLNQLGQSIFQESQNWIARQVASLSEMAEKAENFLMWQAVALVPTTIAFSIFLSAVIARPIRQVDAAFRRLGDAQFDEEIRVKGPKDLQYLGERLNWLRHRLAELEEKKGNFIRHVSHELKTPLTAIKEGSALLDEGLLGPMNSQQLEVTKLLERNCLTLQTMIENLLNLNMIQFQKTVMSITELDFNGLLDMVLVDHRLAILAKNIRLERQGDDNIQMRGDREKLRIIIDNLLSNAIKYSPEGGVLSLSVVKSEQEIVFDIRDSGVGISDDDAQRVFEPFYRGQSTPSDVRGSGLGLSIVKEFVQLHHGTIGIVKDESFSGAHFRMVLPNDFRGNLT